MKSIFLCENKEKINVVYSAKTIEALKAYVGLCEGVLTRADALAGEARDAEYIFSTWGMPHFDDTEVKNCFPNLKAVFYAAGSVQHFAREFIENGIKVFSAWGANAVPVAECTVAEIILANKGFFGAARLASEDKRAEAHELFSAYPGTFETNVGIIGAGMIGKLVIKMLKPYNVKIKVFDAFMSKNEADGLGVELCTLDEVFSTCQTISNHLANNAQTVGMLNYTHFSKMLDNATFINTGRGAQVVEDDLVRALTEKPERTAILDVTYPEPPVHGHPFYSMPNVILTPHLAGSSGREVMRMSEYMLEEFLRLDAGEQTRYEVSLKMLETMA